MTIRQRTRKYKGRRPAARKTQVAALLRCPQKRGVCTKVYQMAPKKPNSAQRWVASLKRVTKKKILAYIPGEGGHGLHEHSHVLVRGGRVRDLPGMHYKMIRGVLDRQGVAKRITSRSKYGTKYKGPASSE